MSMLVLVTECVLTLAPWLEWQYGIAQSFFLLHHPRVSGKKTYCHSFACASDSVCPYLGSLVRVTIWNRNNTFSCYTIQGSVIVIHLLF
jgi:hypothetical protein